MKEKKCKTCNGYGLWAVGDPSPMGLMDYSDGCPTKKCPECKMGGKVNELLWRSLDGRIVPISKLTKSHLKNIIKHIKARDKEKKETKLLNLMIKELNKRK